MEYDGGTPHPDKARLERGAFVWPGMPNYETASAQPARRVALPAPPESPAGEAELARELHTGG